MLPLIENMRAGESLVRSEGTTLRYKAEATAAIKSRTLAKLCRPSAHPDKPRSDFILSSLSLYFLPALSWPHYLILSTLLICCLYQVSEINKEQILSQPCWSGVSTVSFWSPEITTLIPTIAMCGWFKQLSAPLFMLSSPLVCTHKE